MTAAAQYNTTNISRGQAAARIEHLAKVAPHEEKVQIIVAGVLKAAHWPDLWGSYSDEIKLSPEAGDCIWNDAPPQDIGVLIEVSDAGGFGAATGDGAAGPDESTTASAGVAATLAPTALAPTVPGAAPKPAARSADAAHRYDDRVDPDRVRDALSYLSPDCDRDTWVKYAMAIKNGLGDTGFDVWDQWSAQSDKYDARDASSTWKSIKAEGKRTIASLFGWAKDAGWKPSGPPKKRTAAEIEAEKAAAAARLAAQQEIEAQKHAKAAETALRLWNAAKPAEQHPYLTRKRVKAHGLRVGKWERIDEETGEVVVTTDQALLIPLVDPKKNLHSLQAIHPDKNTKKLYLRDGAKRGHFHAIGAKQTDADGNPIFVLAEGYATAASVHECTGQMALVCFDVSNLVHVARVLRAKQPKAIIVFAADNDLETKGNPGVTKAIEAAREVDGLVAVPELNGFPEKACDFNDLHFMEGAGAVQACMLSAAAPPPAMLAVLAPSDRDAAGVGFMLQSFIKLRGASTKFTVIVYPRLGGIQASAELAVSKYKADAMLIFANADDADEAKRVGKIHHAHVELPPDDSEWRGFGEDCLDHMFAELDGYIDPGLRDYVNQALENLAKEAAQVVPARDEDRRRQQQEENARIQEDDGAMIPSKLELDEMLERCVWLAEGEVVAYVTPNRSQFLTYKEFRSLTAESVTFVDAGKKRVEEGEEAEAAKKPILTAKLWQSDKRRKGAMTRTFKAGAGVICADPEGDRAVNLWRPIIRWPATTPIDLFLDHVSYLFEDEVERQTFLDWCAHLEQKPGELPHYGWLHIASHTGCGRNWLASVLARVWRGYVAPNVDLPALLDSQYNGSIARRVLAIVDEIQEGGSGNRRHTNRLTGLLNAETRLINPKFGRQFHEFNSCRWLVFSNHTNALPIDNTDRRWRVVAHEKAPRPAADYERLYAALADKEFINAVGVFLRERDISGFKPGERPPLNAAKAAVIEASKPMQTTLAEDIRDHWPADIILNDHVAEILADQPDAGYTPAMRRAMEEIGAVAIEDQIKINGRAQRGWILRNAESWRGASKSAQRQEINRAGVNTMKSVAAVFADAMDDEPPI